MKNIKAIILIAAIPYLNGCILFAAGAGAEGAYVATQDRSAGDTLTDQRITAEIKSRFIAEPGIAALRINVDTFKSIVTLTGNVSVHHGLSSVLPLSVLGDIFLPSLTPIKLTNRCLKYGGNITQVV